MKESQKKPESQKSGQQSRPASSIGASSREGAKQRGQTGASQFTEQDRADIQDEDDVGVGANRESAAENMMSGVDGGELDRDERESA